MSQTITTGPAQSSTAALEEAIRRAGGPRGVGLAGPRRLAETMQTVAFCFHPGMDIPNIGRQGFNFNVPYPALRRMEPILLHVFPAARIKPRTTGVGFIGATASSGIADERGFEYGGAVPAGGAGKHIERYNQMPSVSANYLVTAHKQRGMVRLDSMTSQGDEELNLHVALFDAVFRTPFLKDKRAVDVELEHWPAFIDQVAGKLLGRFLKRDGLPEDFEDRGRQLIREVGKSVEGLRSYALNPSTGVLPTTKKEMEVAAKTGQGKFFLNDEDQFLLKQFPSFKMDSEVERAQAAMRQTLEHNGQNSSDNTAALLKLAEQAQEANRISAAALAQNTAILQEMAAQRAQSDAVLKQLLNQKP